MTTVAGTGESGYAEGPGTVAKFTKLYGLTFDEQEGNIYVHDSWRIRKIDSLGVNSYNFITFARFYNRKQET